MTRIWGLAGIFGHLHQLDQSSLSTTTNQNFYKFIRPIECGRDGEPAICANPCIQLWGEVSVTARTLSFDKSIPSQQQTNAEQEAVIIIKLPPNQKISVSATNSSNSRHDLGTLYSSRAVETEQKTLGLVTNGDQCPLWANHTPAVISSGKHSHGVNVSIRSAVMYWILDALLSPDSQLQLIAALRDWRQLEIIRVMSAGFRRN